MTIFHRKWLIHPEILTLLLLHDRRWAACPPRRAFTLIEITVVILILGIVAAIAAPRYSDAFHVAQLEAVSLQLAEDIRQIRQSAIHHGRTATLSFDSAAGTYQCVAAGIAGETPAEITFSVDIDSHASLSFDSAGTPRRSGNPITDALITLTWKTETYHVEIGAGTGRVWVMKELPVGSDGSSGGSS